MKQILISIPDVKYSFFMELINNMGFVKVEELGPDSKGEIKNNISAGAKELKNIVHSKPKKQTTLKEFLNEL
jgi:hypothetical protein